MPSFKPADRDVYDVLHAALKKRDRFKPLLDFDVDIEILMAFSGKGQRPLKHAGTPVAAKIKIIKDEERSRGGPDVRILVDGKRWTELPPKSREGLLAHECYHLVVVVDGGQAVKDEYGRPVVGTIPDDYTINGFVEVHGWYGAESLEARSFHTVREMLSQGQLNFGEVPDPDPPTPPPPLTDRGRKPKVTAVDKEIAAGVKEAESAKRGRKKPEAIIAELVGPLVPDSSSVVGQWSSTPIADLFDLSDDVIRILKNHGVQDVADILAHVRAGFFLDRIPGVTATMADSIAAALATDFDEFRRSPIAPPEEEAVDTTRTRREVTLERWAEWDPEQRINAMAKSLAAADLEEWGRTEIRNLDLSRTILPVLGHFGIVEVAQLLEYVLSGKDLSRIPGLTKNQAAAISEALRKDWETLLFDDQADDGKVTNAEPSELDIYDDAPDRVPAPPGHLQVGDKMVSIGKTESLDEAKPKRQRRPKKFAVYAKIGKGSPGAKEERIGEVEALDRKAAVIAARQKFELTGRVVDCREAGTKKSRHESVA